MPMAAEGFGGARHRGPADLGRDHRDHPGRGRIAVSAPAPRPVRRPRRPWAHACAPTASTSTAPRKRRRTSPRSSSWSPLSTAAADGASKLFAPLEALAQGVFLTRDLASEPANVIYPESLAAEARKLWPTLGVEVEVLGEKEMKKLGMGALLGVGQGSAREPQLLVMQWNKGGKDDAARLRRQGRHLRHRRHLDQAGRRHGRHEVGHGRRGRGHRPDEGAGAAQGQGQCGRRRRPGREHARRQRPASRRRRHLHVGPDHRGDQHRRRRPAGAGRRHLVHARPLQAQGGDRSCHADRRDHHRAGRALCRPVHQRRQAGRPPDRRRRARWANSCGACRWTTPTTR